MAQEEFRFFDPRWFKDGTFNFKIKGFRLDPEYFDTGGFIEELTENIAGGYDKGKPIVIARSKDPAIKGEVCDGRHRLYVGDRILRSTGKLPDFSFSFVDVDDLDTLKALRAEFERRNRSKDSRISKKWMERNISDIVQSNLHLQAKLPDYILQKGFKNNAIINRIIKEQRSLREHGKKSADPASVKKFVAASRESWGISGDFEENTVRDSDNGKVSYADDNPDYLSTYKHSCPKCNIALKIVTDTRGNVISVDHGIGRLSDCKSAANLRA
ncbi:MAG: hypothetical protein ACRD5H_07865 [Nitrososphaerales archaeon]